jgi:hypothetical protein
MKKVLSVQRWALITWQVLEACTVNKRDPAGSTEGCGSLKRGKKGQAQADTICSERQGQAPRSLQPVILMR